MILWSGIDVFKPKLTFYPRLYLFHVVEFFLAHGEPLVALAIIVHSTPFVFYVNILAMPANSVFTAIKTIFALASSVLYVPFG